MIQFPKEELATRFRIKSSADINKDTRKTYLLSKKADRHGSKVEIYSGGRLQEELDLSLESSYSFDDLIDFESHGYVGSEEVCHIGLVNRVFLNQGKEINDLNALKFKLKSKDGWNFVPFDK